MTPPPAFLSPVENSNESETSVTESSVETLDAQSQTVTDPFVGQWNTLVSQTNWEKGRIISEWRSALITTGAPSNTFSDDVWSKQVGAVTSQHVGRLRRVYERFGKSQTSFPGLYWSHFLACIDWDDAEMWLEGALRSKWSVAEMRRMRWESSGGDPKHAPRDEELITSEVDDDFNPLTAEADVEDDREQNDRIEASGPAAEGPDFGDEDSNESDRSKDNEEWSDVDSDALSAEKEMVNPFASLPSLPPDVEEALEQFKLCIARHRSSHWADVSQTAILDVLAALQTFASR
jgi:hypothetical protein